MTVKAVVIQSKTQEIFSLYPQNQFMIAFCGSGGRTIADMIHVPYIQIENRLQMLIMNARSLRRAA